MRLENVIDKRSAVERRAGQFELRFNRNFKLQVALPTFNCTTSMAPFTAPGAFARETGDIG